MKLLERTAKIIRFSAGLSISGIAAVHLIVDDSSATKILGNPGVNGVQMVVTLPGAKIEGRNIDALTAKNSIMIWILSKGTGPSSDKIVDQEEYLRLLELTDTVLEKFREAMRNSSRGACPYLAGLDIEQMVTTPEYNTFGGWNGWCAVIAFK